MLTPRTPARATADTALAVRLDACLPQTQCRQCGYPHCYAYAEAVVRGEADINRCTPGADVTIEALASLLGRTASTADPACGVKTERQCALIDEERCIGCRKCIDACPVDAIIGARRFMHTVMAHECSGCELCVPACPVDCIRLVTPPAGRGCTGPWHDYGTDEAVRWRRRHAARAARRRDVRQPLPALAADEQRARRQAEIRAAVDRVHRRRQHGASRPGQPSAG